MNKLSVITMIGLLLAAAPAFAQMANPAGPAGTMPATGMNQTEMSTMGTITAIDLEHRTLALDTGMQFTLAPSLQYTTSPAIDQEVQVTYGEQSGQNVARIIDLGGANINKRSK